MDTEDLKWLTVELHMLYNGWRIKFENEDLYFNRSYGCTTYGDVNELLKRAALVFHRKTRKPVYKVIVTRDTNNKVKAYSIFTGYKYVSPEDILKDAITPKNKQ